MESEEGQAAPRAGGLLREPWLLGAALCVLAAVACLILGYYDAAFVTGALGAVAWFMNYRAQLPSRDDEDDDEDEEVLDEDLEETTVKDQVRPD